MDRSTKPEFDVIIIGAGLTGMYQGYMLRKLGLSVRIIDRNADVGGTWTMNRYPGCKLDSESFSYAYSFLKDLLQEWEWKETFASQPDLNQFFSLAADRMDIRKDIQFNARVNAARFDDAANIWTVELDSAKTLTARFLITAVGALSVPNMPKFKGTDLFRGESFHSFYWPHDPNGWGGRDVDFSGKRVAVIGTGATGVQIITEVGKTAGELYALQRHPNWCAPLVNGPIAPEEMAAIKDRYEEIFATCESTRSGFMHDFMYESALDHSDEERNAILEELYNQAGYAIWVGHYADMLTNAESNRRISEFFANKIRSRVKDPETAEKLIPKDHGFGLKRVPMESGYYETFNRDNVHLVDIKEDPIAEITPTGIMLESGRHIELDIIIYALGFDAIIGGLKAIDFHGASGQTLKEAWGDGPYTYLGLQVPDFPNMFTLVAAHNGATFCNIPRCSEAQVEWVTELFRYITENHVERIECTVEAADEWTTHVYDVVSNTLFPNMTESWFWGEFDRGGKSVKRHRFLVYGGGNPVYRQKVKEVADAGYAGMIMRQAEPVPA